MSGIFGRLDKYRLIEVFGRRFIDGAKRKRSPVHQCWVIDTRSGSQSMRLSQGRFAVVQGDLELL